MSSAWDIWSTAAEDALCNAYSPAGGPLLSDGLGSKEREC